MLMLFLTVALVHIVALMSPALIFLRVANGRQPLPQRGDDGCARYYHGRHGLGGGCAARSEPDPAKMAWLHNIIMVGGGLYLCWMGYQMLRGALKKEENKPEEPKVELATGGRSFVKGLLTNGEPESNYLLRLGILAVCGDNVGAGARWGSSC